MVSNKKTTSIPPVSLRAMEPEDLNSLYALENDWSVWGVSTTTVPYSRSVLIDYITSSKCDIYVDGQVRLMVDNEAGEAVGTVDLTNFDPKHHRAELGMALRNEFRGRGYGKSILHEICEYGRNVIHLHQIYAIVGCDNIGCLKLLKSFGFQGNICLKDWIFFGKEYGDAYFLQKIL